MYVRGLAAADFTLALDFFEVVFSDFTIFFVLNPTRI
jgi:hypothetical protein